MLDYDGPRTGSPLRAEAAPRRHVSRAAEHEGGPPPQRSGFGEIAPERSCDCSCAKAELFERARIARNR